MENFASIIEKMVQTDSEMIEGLFSTFVLNKLVRILINSPNKKEVMCHLLYTFVPEDPVARMKLLQKLSE
jgi:hypothetical protein